MLRYPYTRQRSWFHEEKVEVRPDGLYVDFVYARKPPERVTVPVKSILALKVGEHLRTDDGWWIEVYPRHSCGLAIGDRAIRFRHTWHARAVLVSRRGLQRARRRAKLLERQRIVGEL